ncbi:NAD(P)-binding protein [Streptosporangium saharense]
MKVIIVGGGIGGLATTTAFHRRGHQVEILVGHGGLLFGGRQGTG